MRVFVVACHPEKRSFNFALRDRAVSVLEGAGHDIEASDLSQDGFTMGLERSDFLDHSPDHPLRVLDAQKTAMETGRISSDIHQEQEKLRRCDLLILQFPIWWGSYPGTLKGWIDRVLAYGFAYGRHRTLPAKTVLYSVTVGSTDESELAGDRQRVDSLATDVFGYMGWRILLPFVASGAGELSSETRAETLDRYETHLLTEIALVSGQDRAPQ